MRITVEDTSGRRVVIDGDDLEKAAASAEEWDGTSIAGLLVKSEDERRFTLHVAYPADRADKSRAADGYRDFAGQSATEDAAWSYLLKHRQVGVFHQDGTEGSGDVAESYIYRGPPWVIKAANGSECTILEGDWLIGIRWSEDVWPLVKSGRIAGVSMQGSAVRRRPSPEALAALRS
jgi:hypothetical protein